MRLFIATPIFTTIVRSLFRLIAALVLVANFGCVKKNNLFAEDCAKDNPNCLDAIANISTVGAVSDINSTPVISGASAPQISLKPTRYGQEAVIEYVLTNPRLAPLRPSSLTIAPGDPTITLDSNYEGGCGQTTLLLYSQTCKFKVTYLPGSVPPDQNISIELKTLLGTSYLIYSSLANATVLPDFTITPEDLAFPDTLVYDVSSTGYYEREITVTNHGTDDIANMSVMFPSNEDFALVPGGTGACADGDPLASGANCKVKIRFKPTSAGFKTASLMFAGVPSVTRTYTLRGTGLTVSSDMASVDFGAAKVGTASVTKTVHVLTPSTNGDPDAAQCSMSLSGSPQYQIASNSCASPSAISVMGGGCDLTLQFTPTATASSHFGSLDVTCDDRGGTLNIPLVAESVIDPLTADPSALDFSNRLLGSTDTKSVTFSNVSASALTSFAQNLTTIVGTGLTVDSQTCTTSIAANSSCTVTLKFAPVTKGLSLSNLVASAAEATTPVSVEVKGLGIKIEPSQSQINLGSVAENTDAMGADIFITNPSQSQSATDCTFDVGTSEDEGFSILSGSTCKTATSLSPGESCVIKTKLTAIMPPAKRSATLTMTCAVGGTATITVEGETVSNLSLVALPPAQINYNDRLVGISESQIQKFYNADATATATAVSISTPDMPVTWSRLSAGASDCSGISSLAPGAGCDVEMQFNPLSTFGSEQVGTYAGEIIATSTDATPEPVPYSGVSKKILGSVPSYDFGTVSTGVDKDSTIAIFIQNPSSMDTATGCSLTLSAPFQAINSNCGSVIDPSGVCQFTVRLPSQPASATLNGTARMDCSVGGRAEVALNAIVQKPATVEWVLGDSYDYGDVDIGSNEDQVLTLKHTGVTGDAPSGLPVIVFTAASSPAYTITSNMCTAPLNPGDECDVTVRFAPATAGPLTASLEGNYGILNYDTINLTGNGVDPVPRLEATPTTITITDRLVGISVDNNITVSNNAVSGAATDVVIGNPDSGAPWTLGTSPSPCGSTLDVGNTCTVVLNYAPVSAGTTTGTVSISASNSTTKTVNYSGTALQIMPSTSTLDFGTVDFGLSKTHPTTVTITNPSSTDTASGCTLAATGPFSLVGPTCGATLATNGTCAFQVELTAQSVEQTWNETVSMTCTIGGTATIELKAITKDLPDLRWASTPDPAFGDVDVDANPLTRTFTLENIGASTAQLTSFGFTTSSPGFTVFGGTCSATSTLAGGQSCTVDISFDPQTDTTASGGETAVLSAGITDPVPANYDLTFTGTGTTLTLEVDQSSLTFNDREVGQTGSETKTVVLSNTGTRSATLTYSALTDPPFALSGTCGASLAAGASCNLVFDASATAAPATHTQTLTVTDTNNGATKTVTVDLNGKTVGEPVLQGIDNLTNTTYAAIIAETDITGPTNDPRNIVDGDGTKSQDVTYTIKNDATDAATLNNVTLALNFKSGTNGTMSLVSDTCSSTDLAAQATCSFTVRYTPLSAPEGSIYTLTATGTDAVTSATHTFTVTDIVGNSLPGASLTIVTPIKISGAANASLQSAIVDLENTGSQTANISAYNFTGTDGSYFSRDTGVAGACGASLAGGATCKIRLKFAPASVAGTFTASLDIVYTSGSSATNMTVSSAIKGATYNELVFGNEFEGMESDLASDTARYYVISRTSVDRDSVKRPLLKICSKTARGALDPATCVSNDVANLLGPGAVPSSPSNLAGNLVGSGPKIQQSGNKIIIAVQNKDTSLGGEATVGTSTVIICQKPTSGNTLAAASCRHFVLNSAQLYGQFPALAVSGDKIVLATMSSTKQLILTACSYTDSTSVISNTDLNLGSCATFTVASIYSGQYASLSFNGTRAVIASYDDSALGTSALRLSACNVASDNTISGCQSAIKDNELLADSGDNLYPGAFPSVAVSGDDVYIVHQHGADKKMRLRLTTCSLDGSNNATCSNQTIDSASGVGLTPQAVVSGSSASGTLWITSVKLTNAGDNNSFGSVGIYKCSLPMTVSSCDSTPYFLQENPMGIGPILARSLYFDSVGKQLIIPFEASADGSYEAKSGVINFGLLDEI